MKKKKKTLFQVKVIPNAKQNEIVSFSNNELKVRIKAPPEKGKANQELISFLAKHFNVPKSDIEIIQGETSSNKKLVIDILFD